MKTDVSPLRPIFQGTNPLQKKEFILIPINPFFNRGAKLGKFEIKKEESNSGVRRIEGVLG